VWQRWLTSYPELNLVDLDVGRGQSERRSLARLTLLARPLMPYDERIVHSCLELLVDGNASGAGALAIAESRKGAMLPDIHLLAGAAHLADGRFDDAVNALRECYGPERHPGDAIRRLCPSLRIELRLSPCLLVPLYPNQFSSALLFALAQWRAGQSGEALDTIGEMVSQWGLYDEVKLLAGQIHLDRGDLDHARRALTAGEDTKHDALEFARNFFLAFVYYRKGEYRNAIRTLMPALMMVTQVNPHLHARARLLIAECFDRCDLPLNALRQSAHVLPQEVPGEVCTVMLQREERWIVELEHLTHAEIERMSRADQYQVYIPDKADQPGKSALLSTTRDPLKNFRTTERSWRKIRAEEQQIAEYRAAVAMGRSSAPPRVEKLSGDATEFKLRIGKAVAWWPGRRAALEKGGARSALSRSATEAGHLRYDFQGMQARSTLKLAGEKRAAFVSAFAGAALLIAICLLVIRSCIY
jgi:tetratricopeptide (TPR) repeat protein